MYLLRLKQRHKERGKTKTITAAGVINLLLEMLCSVGSKCCFYCYGDCNRHTGSKFVLIYLDSSIEPVFNTFHTCDDVVVRWSESLQVAEEEWPIV